MAKNKTKDRIKAIEPLPNEIRNELRMAFALKGHDHMRGGKGKTLRQQNDFMHTLYHGKEPSRPSQIDSLCKGSYQRMDSCETKQNMSASKSDSSSTTTELFLKKNLHRHPTRRFRATKEINFHI